MLRVLRPMTWCRVQQQLRVKQFEIKASQFKTNSSKLCCIRVSSRNAILHNSQQRWYCTENNQLSTTQYEHLADETLDSLSEMFEDLPERLECDPEYDVTFGSGVLTVCISKSWGTYVINKQVPNKQIWLSSPISGPKRYDYIDGVWVYKHEGGVLHELLTTEISKAIGEHVDFTQCSNGKS